MGIILERVQPTYHHVAAATMTTGKQLPLHIAHEQLGHMGEALVKTMPHNMG